MRIYRILKSVFLAFVSLFLLLGSSSCIQREDIPFRKEYKVIGRLVKSCNDPTPISDKLVLLENPPFFDLFCKTGYKVVSRAYTNADGYFELRYEQQNCLIPLKVSIEDPNGHPTDNFALVTDIKEYENTHLGNVYLKPSVIYNYVVKTNTPYTNTDTLYYNIERSASGKDSTYAFITGPFTEGQVLATYQERTERQIHHGDLALQDERYDYEYYWLLKSSGNPIKRSISRIIFRSCVLYTITIDLSL